MTATVQGIAAARRLKGHGFVVAACAISGSIGALLLMAGLLLVLFGAPDTDIREATG